jgi:hypothetical protein
MEYLTGQEGLIEGGHLTRPLFPLGKQDFFRNGEVTLTPCF